VRALLVALPNEVLLDIVSARCWRCCLLQPGHRAADGHAGRAGPAAGRVALGLVLGANLGSGVLAMLVTTLRSEARAAPAAAGQPAVQGSLGALLAIPLLP
jgi:phosphate:Na+ symporter